MTHGWYVHDGPDTEVYWPHGVDHTVIGTEYYNSKLWGHIRQHRTHLFYSIPVHEVIVFLQDTAVFLQGALLQAVCAIRPLVLPD